MPPVTPPSSPATAVLLTDLGLVRVHGPEATTFLQAQLTNDIATLDASGVRLAGYCSVKGRLLATFWIWRDDAGPTYWLACSRDVVAAVAKRLAMFVLRAKVKVEAVGDEQVLIGLIGPADAVDSGSEGAVRPPRRPLPSVVLGSATRALAGGLVAGDESRTAIAAPVEVTRAVEIVPATQAEARLAALSRAGIAIGSLAHWHRLEVLSGIARIVAATQDRFVPQMVNFERVGGVSFRKGCYPGQEVVARSQYLGKLKRRMVLGLVRDAVAGEPPSPTDRDLPAPGDDVLPATPGGPAEPIGQVVQAERLADGSGYVVLFECRTDSLAAPDDAGSADDRPVARIGRADILRLPLPYPIVDAAPSDAA